MTPEGIELFWINKDSESSTKEINLKGSVEGEIIVSEIIRLKKQWQEYLQCGSEMIFFKWTRE